MNIISNSVPSKQSSKTFKLTYFQSRALNPADKLIVGSNQYDIKPGFQITIPKNTLYSVISSDPNSYRIYKKINIIDIKAVYGINVIKKAMTKNKGFFKNDSIFKDYRLYVMIFFSRLCSYIPVPGIDTVALKQLFDQQAWGILGMISMFSGGALSRMSLFALGIMPFYASLIIIRLFGKKINPLTKQLILVLILVVCGIQSYGLSIGLETQQNIVNNPGPLFRLTTILSLSTTTLFFSWFILYQFQDKWETALLSLISMGIIAGLPSAGAWLIEAGRQGALSTLFILSMFAFILIVIYGIVYIFSTRKNEFTIDRENFRNIVQALIYSSAVILLPSTISNFTFSNNAVLDISSYFARGQPLYYILYSLLIFVFINVMVKNNISDVNIFSINIPYKIYISAFAISIALIPEILISQYSVPLYFGGISLLIILGIVLQIIDEITIKPSDSNLFLTLYVLLIIVISSVSLMGIDQILSIVVQKLLG